MRIAQTSISSRSALMVTVPSITTNANGGVSSSMLSATRASRRSVLPFSESAAVVNIRDPSASSANQIGATWGRPSRRVVASAAVRVPWVTNARHSGSLISSATGRPLQVVELEVALGCRLRGPGAWVDGMRGRRRRDRARLRLVRTQLTHQPFDLSRRLARRPTRLLDEDDGAEVAQECVLLLLGLHLVELGLAGLHPLLRLLGELRRLLLGFVEEAHPSVSVLSLSSQSLPPPSRPPVRPRRSSPPLRLAMAFANPASQYTDCS